MIGTPLEASAGGLRVTPADVASVEAAGATAVGIDIAADTTGKGNMGIGIAIGVGVVVAVGALGEAATSGLTTGVANAGIIGSMAPVVGSVGIEAPPITIDDDVAPGVEDAVPEAVEEGVVALAAIRLAICM